MHPSLILIYRYLHIYFYITLNQNTKIRFCNIGKTYNPMHPNFILIYQYIHIYFYITSNQNTNFNHPLNGLMVQILHWRITNTEYLYKILQQVRRNNDLHETHPIKQVNAHQRLTSRLPSVSFW